MSKLLIALLALDIGVSLSKVFIFTWKSKYLAKEKQLFSKKRNIYLAYNKPLFLKQEIVNGYYLFDLLI